MAIMVANLRTAFTRTRPVRTGVIPFGPREIRHAIRQRTRQNIMLVRLIAKAANTIAVLIHSCALNDIRANMQRIQIRRNQLFIGIVPRPCSDPIPRRNATFPVRLRAQIRFPGAPFRTRRFGQTCAMRIRTVKPAQICAITYTYAGHKEPHRLVLRTRGYRSCNNRGCGENCHTRKFHRVFSHFLNIQIGVQICRYVNKSYREACAEPSAPRPE